MEFFFIFDNLFLTFRQGPIWNKNISYQQNWKLLVAKYCCLLFEVIGK